MSDTRRQRGHRARSLACGWILLALLAAACGGGGGDSDAADGPSAGSITTLPATSTLPTTTTLPTLAQAIRIDEQVDARIGAADFATVAEPLGVAVGDVVRTDASGFAEISYFDGSLTRLDVDTTFEVIELVDTPDATKIRTAMGLGRTWHRVEALSGSSVYEVETSVAIATVRGTAFVVTCTPEGCRFEVLEGEVGVTVDADGATIELGPGMSLFVPVDPTVDDDRGLPTGREWFERNRDLDLDAGFADLDVSAPEPAMPDGVYEVAVVGGEPIGTVGVWDGADFVFDADRARLSTSPPGLPALAFDGVLVDPPVTVVDTAQGLGGFGGFGLEIVGDGRIQIADLGQLDWEDDCGIPLPADPLAVDVVEADGAIQSLRWREFLQLNDSSPCSDGFVFAITFEATRVS